MIRAIQIRNMNTGIHELFRLKPKANAVQTLSLFESLNNNLSESLLNFVWFSINQFTEQPIEINFRNYETSENGNKYFLVNGEKIFVVNQNHIDIW